MNELIQITNSVAECNKNEVTKELMMVFRAVTPQFYKSMTDQDLKAEALSIRLLTQNIDQPTLAEMCRLAVQDYPIARSVNPKVYFDMNYILIYYTKAYNNVHCYNVELPKDAEMIKNSYDAITKTVKETWQSKQGKIEISFIVEDNYKKERYYSPRFFERLVSDLENIEF